MRPPCRATGTSRPTWSWWASGRRAPAPRLEAAAAERRLGAACSTVSAAAAPPRCPAASSTPMAARPQQRAAGVDDSPGAMFGYLRTEVGDAVPAATLRQFCDGSVAMLAWLEGHGVPFEGSLCPDKTSYPTNRHYLYYSGSELSAAACAGAPAAAARGHRTSGRGTSGGLLYARLAAAVRAAGVRVLTQTTAREAGHRSRRPGHRGGVHDPARRARLGPAGAPRAAPLVGQALPVRAEGRPDPAPPRGLAGAALRTAAAGRGGPRRGRRGRRGFAANRPMMRAARAGRARRAAAGHPGRRRQRHQARHRR